MFVLAIFVCFLFLSEKSFNSVVPDFKTEFELDLDKDGTKDFLSLSSGKVALSSDKFRTKRIRRFNPLYATVKENEIWLSNIGKALTYEKGVIILRELSLKEQIWLRMYRLEAWRADLLTFNLLLSLLTILISIEKIYRFANSAILKNLKREPKILFVDISWLLSFLLFVFLLHLTKKFLYVSWIWVIPLIQYYFQHFFPREKLLLKIKGLFLLFFILSFLYISYFGFWYPVF